MPAIALQRYRQRHIEPALPAPPTRGSWRQVLVIPAYRESPALLDGLLDLQESRGRILVIIVLNRPDHDCQAAVNAPLRAAVTALPAAPGHNPQQGRAMHVLAGNIDVLLYDLENLRGPSPGEQGVGLARKAGCDIALDWIVAGRIGTDWICNTDGDALLPADYFSRLPTPGDPSGLTAPTRPDQPVAAVYPFQHLAGGDQLVDEATALYELRLHHYVLGLEYAGSPYACHTLGSCLAVRALPYAQVRGFGRRAAGEDFYLLNKLAKVGPVAKLEGNCIALRSRASSRVPFGTGPAVARVSGQPSGSLDLFYHPSCFEALRQLLLCVAGQQAVNPPQMAQALMDNGLDASLSGATATVANALGWQAALEHCRRQGRTDAAFLRHFHQWFDGFRTMKFIHGLRAAGWADQTLAALPALRPRLWPAPATASDRAIEIRRSVIDHWRWIAPDPTLFTRGRDRDRAGW